MCDFVHLHNHSHYSLQDAAATIDGLVNKAVEFNMKSLALTDHGVMYGISEFYKKATKAKIKPIIGVEAYIYMDGSRFDRGENDPRLKSRKTKPYNHLVLLAKNRKGYENLMKLSTLGHLEGFYYRPRIDLELLNQYKEGLICTSACLAGPICAPLLNGDYEKARSHAILFKEMFGDDFYLELQDHGLEEDKIILEAIPKLSKELNIEMIATNDIHYIEREHSIAHNILLLLGDKTGNGDYKELRYGTDEIYFKSPGEMKDLFKNYKGAIENTVAIDEKINLSLDFSGFHYPLFPIPENSGVNNLDDYLDLLAREGLQKRFKTITPSIEDRFNYELEVIKSMGYSGYFLIVQDFINAAKKKGIPVGPGRGSAAGSLVAFALGITNVDPLKYNLLFERFLNPARKSMPDIDVDFADDKRGDVIEYTKNKYGEESVCQIVTFNRLSSKAVIRDVARVLKIPIPQVNEITKWIPSKFGRVYTIEQALQEVPELKWVKTSDDPKIQELIKYSRILEGMNRNVSKHAAGIVITPGQVSDFVPLSKAGAEGDIVTQFNMKELDDAGLLKMDFLGLRTLTIIRDTIDLVKKTRNIIVDIDEIPFDDEETYKIFSRGRTTGVFQFESAPMREYLKKLRPSSINDLAAMNALYRPGPMEFIDDFIARKHGKKKIEYLHPYLEEILKETYGIIVYQEQVIQIANKIGGLSLSEADLLRRAMGKKDLKAMQEQHEKFVNGAVKNNIDKKIAKDIFVAIDKFANYGFNKSHAVAYGIVAYQTAYLKAHFLPEFLAANLTNEFGNTDKVTILLDDCRKLHVKVLPPDVNKPSVFFNVEKGRIIFGMSAIKNVGVSAVEEITRARKELGRDFLSIYDFCSNVDTRIVNKRALEGLVLAGAFDKLKGTRAQNFEAIESALSFGSKVRETIKTQSQGLFGNIDEVVEIVEPELPKVEKWNTKHRLTKEREVLGFYLSDHPLKNYLVEYKSFANVHLGEPETFKANEYVRCCGVITSVRTKTDKQGRQMAFFKIDDFSGSCECLIFSKGYKEYGDFIQPESTVVVKGKLESSGDEIKIHTEEIIPLEEARDKLTKRIGIYLHSDSHNESTVITLKELFEKHEGETPVFIRVVDNGLKRDFHIPDKVKISDEFLKNVTKIVGEEAYKFSTI
ncbi:MAG: DNA polymerase III subunit alpha [Melioribacteraceae bacterium]|nr:DNA polymerase III subunit alpha [Melioribacteraceae bacterium]